MILYLAQFTVARSAYMGKTNKREYIRLVRAPEGIDPETIVREKFEKSDSYGDNSYVLDLDISEVLE